MTITSVTEVIEVIGYQLWRGVLWPYCLGMYRSFNPENWIRRPIREANQDDRPTLEISGIPVCQNDGISVGRYSTCPEVPGRLHSGSTISKLAKRLSYDLALDLEIYEPRRIKIVFKAEEPASCVEVFADGPTESPHRYGEKSLCMWYPADPRKLRWLPEHRLVGLI